MATFEYVSVLLSIVVSLAFTHLLAGAVRLIQARGVKFSVAYAGWFWLLLFWCIDYWFSVWHLRDANMVWSLGFVAFLLLMATVLYVACGLATPGDHQSSQDADLNAFHNANRRKFLAALFVYQVLSIFGNLAIGPLQAAAWVNIGQLTLIGAAWLWGGSRTQIVAVALMWLLTGWYAYTFIPAL
ncbi:hypothetical protein [Candidatus Viadribacter manganicus]|uniref:Uncharacterized protein n=1 Tax=Candidatus Viadribacter manganicus TaxID=1759059 RepID=A0A1B1ALJ3_9PROT|nr:hypothetical protein [Candidatus Viadribacter manganicus]ANP47448.1 hypothetical protein ATE48_16795 [Candidatus Viadribacter manganicus]